MPPTCMLTRRQLGVATAVATVAGCDRDRPSQPAGGRTDRVTYLTGFGVSGRESHAWVAQAKGFFAEAGLEVAIEPGAAGDSNHQILAAGKAQFAGVDASGAFIRYGRGADTSFQIVAAVQQTTLLSIVTLDGNRINSPRDLEGRRIGVGTGAAPKTLFPAYAKLAGVDAAKVTWIDSTPQQLTPLLVAGQVDAIGLFVVGTPAVEKAARRKTVVLPYSTYISDLYGTVLVTPKALVEHDPDLVRRFTGALLRGLAYAIEHPDEAGQILHRAAPTQDPAVAAQEMTLMRPYALPARGASVGVLDPSRVARCIAVLQSLALIPPGLTGEQLVRFDLLGAAPKVTA